jgi:putative ABC transport system substrate-binding protein
MKHSRIALIIVVVLLTNMLGTAYARESNSTYQIALLLFGGVDGFKAKMAEYGYVEGENLTYMYLDMQDVPMEEFQTEYEKQVQAMVSDGVDVFVTETDSDAVYLRGLIGDSVPIVFARADDPVASGAVASLVSPGGNITGTVTNKPHERRLQLLTEIKPTTKKVYYIISSYALGSDATLQQVQAVADGLGVEIVPITVDMGPGTFTVDPGDWLELVQNMPEDTDWIFFTPWVFMDEQEVAELMTLSVERHIGLSYIIDEPVKGYIVSYGPNINDSSGQGALQVDRILRGASPADLPVQTAENYLTLNLEAAQAIGLDIPESVLRQANLIVRPGYFESLATATPGN